MFHDVRPMTPTVVPSERRPSAGEEVSRPSVQNLTHPASESGKMRRICLSLSRGCGFGETSFLRRWRSKIIAHRFVLATEVSFQSGSKQQQGPTVEHELKHFGACYEAARSPSKGRIDRIPYQWTCGVGWWLDATDSSIADCVAPATCP